MNKYYVKVIVTIACLLCSINLVKADELPKNGLVYSWDFNENGIVDLVNNIDLHLYQEKDYKIKLDTLKTGDICADMPYVYIPYTFRNMPDVFTIVVQLQAHIYCDSGIKIKNKKNGESYSLFDDYEVATDDVKGSVLTLFSKKIKIEDECLKIEAYTDTTFEHKFKHDIPLKFDSVGNFSIIVSIVKFRSMKVHGYKQDVCELEIATSGEMYRVCMLSGTSLLKYDANNGEELRWCVDIPWRSKLIELNIYDRLLDEKEIETITGMPIDISKRSGGDLTSMGWQRKICYFVIIFMVLRAIICFVYYFRMRLKRPQRGELTNNSIEAQRTSRESLDRIWYLLGGKENPTRIMSSTELKEARQEYCMACKCESLDIVSECNEVRRHLNKYYKPVFVIDSGVFGVVLGFITLFLAFIGALLSPLFGGEFIYTLTTNKFMLYYLIFAVTLFCCVTVKIGEQNKEEAKEKMEMMAKGIGMVVVSGAIGGYMSVLIVIGLVATITVAMLFRFVVVAGGVVVRSGIGGFGVGLIIAALVCWLLFNFVAWLYGIVMSILVVITPIVALVLSNLDLIRKIPVLDFCAEKIDDALVCLCETMSPNAPKSNQVSTR